MEKDYSLDALGRFFDYAAEKGLVKRNTAMGRKGAALKILNVLDVEEARDLRAVDVERASEQFNNLSAVKYKPESLRVYASRAKSAIAEFIRYTDDPASYKPSVTRRTSVRKAGDGNAEVKAVTSKASSRRASSEAVEQNSGDKRNVGEIAIPIPIRDGVIVRVQGIPTDLSQGEADKIANVVKAYATNGS